jgi:hypothetical protein
MELMEIVLIVASAAIGSIVTNIIHTVRSTSGTLRIDHSNPERDVYRLELDNLDELNKKSRVDLKIDRNADLSQK